MKNSSIKWLSEVTGRKKWYIAFLIGIQAIIGASSVYYALLLRNIIDCAVSGDKHGFRFNVVLIVLVVLLQIGLRAVSRHYEEKSRATFENLLKNRLFSNLLKKDYASVTSVHSAEWINRLTNDSVVCANGLVEILPGLGGMAVKLVGAMVMILALEPRFAYIIIPGGAAMLFFTYGFRKVLKKLHKNIQEKDGKLRVFYQENLSSLVMVRSFAAEEQTSLEADKKMDEHKAARMKRNNFSNVCNIGFGGAMNGMYILGVIFGGIGIIGGTMSYGTLTAILQLISQIQSPFANITGYLPKFYAVTASAERIMEAERFADDCPNGVRAADEVKKFYHDKFKAIEFENAGFTYLPYGGADDGKTKMPVVLKNISVEIKKGEYIAFAGHSGCGKSTLLKLMMCLYSLDSGERWLLGSEKISLTSEWHRLFAYVPQGNQLMSGTIRDIIAFADKSQMNNDEKIMRAIEIACADDFIGELENGIDTLLGERGTGLSEGQMQRIAVARAIFSDSPILLLDEATSALDEATEKRMLENLKKMTDKTVMIVTHRPAAFEICDRILEFTEEGIEWKKTV